MYQSCYSSSPSKRATGRAMLQSSFRTGDNAQNINYNSTDPLNGAPCWGDDSNQAYLNIASVWDALRLPTEWRDEIGTWQDCNGFILNSYNRIYNDTYVDMMNYYDQFLKRFDNGKRSLRVLHYNGDVDLVCNWLGALQFGEELAARQNLTVISQ